MSGLLHLVEAATALTHLPVGPANLLPSSSSAASTSPVPTTGAAALSTASLAQSYRIATHAISDDDDVTSGSIPSTNMADILRENHIQALRAAAADAGLVTTPAPAPPACQPSKDQAQPLMTAPATAQVQSPHPHQVMTRISRGGGGDGKESFPMRLLALLSDPKVRDVISWLPHGTSFVVLRPDVFATRVLPLYFAPEGSNSLNSKSAASIGRDGILQFKNRSKGVHKYPSFTRKLNRWGFRQISRGPDAGAFCHELFRRDEPELCRGMVCQKSRKGNKSLTGLPDDLMSVSSASTMGTKSVASREKRPYSSTVTVSTAGGTSNKSLPPKKRKSGQHITNSYMMNDIPSMISHRNQKMSGFTSSTTESDLTSDYGSMCSNNAVPKALPKPAAPEAPTGNNTAVTVHSTATPEAAAREALARHLHEQHRALALASLMENSRLAMEAVGMTNQVLQTPLAAAIPMTTTVQQAVAGYPNRARYFSPPILGAVTTHSQAVFAPTVSIPEERKPAAALSSAQAAKNALYTAYLQALSSNATSRTT